MKVRVILLTGLLTASAAQADDFVATPLVRIPKATYTTCPHLNIPSRNHTAEIPEFYLEEDEVTQRQYGACVQAGKCKKPKYQWPHADQPVTGVSFYDAQSYCQWIGRRLPGYGEWWRALYPPDPNRRTKEPPAIDFSATTFMSGAHVALLYCPRFVISDIFDDKCGYRQPQIVLRVQEQLTQEDRERIAATFGKKILFLDPPKPRDMTTGVGYDYERPIYDLIGNVSEWLADWVADSVHDNDPSELTPRRQAKAPMPRLPLKYIAGGNFLDTSVPLECETGGGQGSVEANKRRRELGFRCAADSASLPAGFQPVPLPASGKGTLKSPPVKQE